MLRMKIARILYWFFKRFLKESKNVKEVIRYPTSEQKYKIVIF